MFTIHDVVAGILVPAAVAALTLMLLWRVARRRVGRRDSPNFAVELATAVGFCAGWSALFGNPGVPPSDATGWLLWVALPWAIVSTTVRLLEVPCEARLILTALGVAVVYLLLAWPLLSAGGIDAQAMRPRVALAALLTWVCLVSMELLGERMTLRRTQSIWLAATLLAGATLVLSGSERLAKTEVLLLGGGLGCLVATMWLGRAGNGAIFATTVGMLHGGILLSANLYADLGAGSAAMLLLAPVAAWFGEPIAHRRLGAEGAGRAALQLALVVAAAGVPLWLAWQSFSAGE